MNVLVALDRSVESRNALETALDVVGMMDGRIVVVHTITPDGDRSMTEQEQRADEILGDAVNRAKKRDVSLETVVLNGDPVEEIVEYAESHDVDAIYVGHRGLASEQSDLSGERRGPLGSVAKGLVDRARIPVTVFDRGL